MIFFNFIPIFLMFLVSFGKRPMIMACHTPTGEKRQAAIGHTGGRPKSVQRAFTPGPDSDPIPPPQPGDWPAFIPSPIQAFYQKLGFSSEAAWGRDRSALVQKGDGS
jgi:hypothetical protein